MRHIWPAVVVTALLTLGLGAGVVATLRAQSKLGPIPTPVTVNNGRWQVVNGAPEA